MIETLKKLRELKDNELIEKYDHLAKGVTPNSGFYLAEIHRRDQDKQTKALKNLTIWITIMTLIMTVATIINIFL